MNPTKRRPKHHTTSLCVECGPRVIVDEDGCCSGCGNTAVGTWLEEHDPVARAERLEAALRGCVEALDRIAAPGYGIDMTETYEELARYWADQALGGRDRARAALAAAREVLGE